MLTLVILGLAIAALHVFIWQDPAQLRRLAAHIWARAYAIEVGRDAQRRMFDATLEAAGLSPEPLENSGVASDALSRTGPIHLPHRGKHAAA